jgi:leucyl aminopeptidase
LGESVGLDVELLDDKALEKQGYGGVIGVGKGSSRLPRLVRLTHRGSRLAKKPKLAKKVALVGKGITFDTGGISIKPAASMHFMTSDMGGAAAVIATVALAAQLELPIDVTATVPMAENMPSSTAQRPGDVLTQYGGITVEVLNTDAEGRLILADALAFAVELGAAKIVDAATLTGACVIALGHAASGVMSNDDAFAERFLHLVDDVGERYWRLPLFPEYEQQIKSDIADLKNTGGRPAGAETAGTFLKNFVAGTPWIHLDVAGTAYLDNESPYLAKGPTGTPVRAFVALAEELAAHGFSSNGVATKKESAAV